jgi:hypothetical protein
MATYIFLGHGGFDQKGTAGYPPEVLIPTDTTLKFYSDAGQALSLPATDDGKTDYSSVVPAWKQLKDQGPGLTATMQTYNFSLVPETHDEERDAIAKADWNGATPITLPAGEQYLCQGTPDTCPTPALLTNPTEEDLSNPERWKHKCTGILGQYGGNNNELHWAACTSFQIKRHDLPVLDTASVTGPGDDTTGEDPDFDEIRTLNAKNVKETAGGGSLAIVAGGQVVLIGARHGVVSADYVRRQNDKEEGLLTVTKAGAFSKGAIEVKGISAKQAVVKAEIGEFSEKSVKFV